MFGSEKTPRMPTADEALSGRDEPMPVAAQHFVTGESMQPPFSDGLQQVVFGMGCFWGAEKLFWPIEGVFTTAVGYAGGYTPNPDYREVCSGRTGHTEVVLVVYDPLVVPLTQLLSVFWEGHDPTQGMRQGNDRGTQYRSAVLLSSDDEVKIAEDSRDRYQQLLGEAGQS